MKTFYYFSYNRFTRYLDRLSFFISGDKNSRFFDLKVSTFAFLFTIFFAFPSLWLYLEPGHAGRLADFMTQAENPLTRELPLHSQVLGYRFLVPLVNYLIGFRGYAVVIPAILASFINLFLCSRLISKTVLDSRIVIFSLISISLSWFIAEGTSFWGTSDSFAHLFTLLPLALDLSPASFIICTPLSMLVDERSLISIIFGYIFILKKDHNSRLFKDRNQNNLLKYFTGSNAIYNALYIILGLFIWKIFRIIIDSGLLASPPDLGVIKEQFSTIQIWFPLYWREQILNHLSAFKWLYFYPLILILLLDYNIANKFNLNYKDKDRGFFILYLVLFVSYSFVTLLNGDVWRSISFSYLFIIESILILYKISNNIVLNLSRYILIFMVITPVSFFGLGLNPQISFPLPLVLIRTFLGYGDSLVPYLRNLFPF